jgi:hypothetical protein
MFNPWGFKGIETGPGQIQLSWKPVKGASYYVVLGPGSSYGGVRVDSTKYLVTGAPAGAQDWLVGTYYLPGPMSTPASAFSKVTVNSWGPPQTNTYRVVATGFTVVKELYDDPLDRDGKRNEIYAAFPMFHFRDGVDYDLVDRDLRRTKSYGDVSKDSNRVRAGSGSTTGGLQTGDAFPSVPTLRVGAVNDSMFPIRVWEGALTDLSDFTIIYPQLWEWGGNTGNYDNWFSYLVTNAPVMWANGRSYLQWGQTTIPANMALWQGGSSVATWFNATSFDRPIGIMQGPQGINVQSSALLLTRRDIEASLSKLPPGSPPRIALQFHFDDDPYVPYAGGKYILYLEVERFP